MKIVLILIMLHGTKCTSFPFPDLSLQHYHVPILNINDVNQSILYSKENHNGMLINFILKDIFPYQPVLLVSGDSITMDGINNRNTNIILLTENLNIDNLKTEVFKTLLFSYWSVLYLVITSRSKNYVCQNGTLNVNAYAETKNYLNELWQVFRIARVTVSFPYTCPKHYVIYHEKEWSGTDVYNRSIRLIRPKNKGEYASALAYSGDQHNLAKDYPLRLSIFYRFPTSITECDIVSEYTNIDFEANNNYCGLDGMIMHDYIKHHKFNASLVKDESCDKYGYSENKTIFGSLGCIVRQQIDISFNSRFLWQYTTKSYYFLHCIFQESLCVMLRRTSRIPLWHYAGIIFFEWIWAGILSCIFLLGTLKWLAAKLLSRFSDKRPLKLHSYILNAIHTTFFGVLLKNDGRFLLLKSTSLLCSIIILAVYQGHINYQFTTRSYFHELETLEELYASPCVLYTTQSIMNFIKPTMDLNNANQAAYLERAQIQNSIAMEYIIDHPLTATIVRKKDVLQEALQNHTDKYGLPQVYVIDKSCLTFYLSYISKDSFLFIEETIKFMMRLSEAGLPDKYYIWTTPNTIKSAGKWPGNGPTPRPFKKISLKKLRISFGILLLGYVVSGLVFIVEYWKGRKPGNKVCCIISR